MQVREMQAGLGYHQLQRSGARGWWRPLVGVAALLATLAGGGFLLAAVALLQIAFTGGSSADLRELLTLKDLGPAMFAALLLSLGILVPVAFLVVWGLHGLRPGWLSSVAGRIRWRYLIGCLGLALLALIVTIGVSSVLPTGTREEITAQPHAFDSRMAYLLVIALLLTPLQAAGEEYLFRGYLTQVFGGFLSTGFAILVPAVLFALAHGAQSLPVFIDRFAFGLVAGVLVVATGGIEAGLAMHVVNNWFAFGLAIVFSSLGDALQASGGTWWTLPGTLVQSLLYLVLAVGLARRQGLATHTPGLEQAAGPAGPAGSAQSA
jgi:membrane protease YdiL (CAAX protease family)